MSNHRAVCFYLRLVDIYIAVISEAFKILYSDGVYHISNLYVPQENSGMDLV